MRVSYAYGWNPDVPDPRDHLLHLQVRLPLAAALPSSVDLLSTGFLNWPVYDQLRLGSCVLNATAGGLRFEAAKQGLADIEPSRLWLYYQVRKLEGDIADDAGASIRDAFKVVATMGWPPESEWPYDIEKFRDEPPAAVDTDALKDRVTQYLRVAVSPNALRQALAAGFPVEVGFDVYPEIESDQAARTGMIPAPRRGATPIGGHAMLCVGYDDSKALFKLRNSWGEDWGDRGHAYMPYTYLGNTTYAQDFWTIRQIVVAVPPAPGPETDTLHALAALIRSQSAQLDEWQAASMRWLEQHGL